MEAAQGRGWNGPPELGRFARAFASTLAAMSTKRILAVAIGFIVGGVLGGLLAIVLFGRGESMWGGVIGGAIGGAFMGSRKGRAVG